jgi:F-type H+-transporting ATPase subunit epsilon
MARTFHLTVAKVGENLFEGDVFSVTLPGSEGVFQVLAGHEAFVSELKSGDVHIMDAENKSHHLAIAHGGIAEISRGQATILV